MELGVIGLPMLVRKVQWIAQDVPYLNVHPLFYETMLDAPRIAAENQNKVDALYFMGTSPYFLAASVIQPVVPWYYQECPIDGLPFALFSARAFWGETLNFSIDTLTAPDVDDVLRDAGCNIGSIYTYAFKPSESYDDEVRDFHLAHFQRGRVSFCLTCAYVVYKTLYSMGIPVFFIAPTLRMIRKSLSTSLQNMYPAETDYSRLVVGLLVPETMPSSVVQYEDAVRSMQKTIFSYAKKRDILVFQRNASMYQCVQTYTQFHLETEDFRKLPLLEELGEVVPDVRLRIGYGVALNIKSAEQYAEKALDMGHPNKPCLFDGEKGRILSSALPVFAVTASDPVFRFYSQKLNVTPASFSRYLRAFRMLNMPFSSGEFSKALGLHRKSSRKILARFLKEGLITLESYRAPLTKGRPESLYKLHPKLSNLNGS